MSPRAHLGCCLWVVLMGCGRSTSLDDAGLDATSDSRDAHDAADALDAFDCDETCIVADFGAVEHSVSPLLFGDNLEWTQSGQQLWDLDVSDPSAANLGQLRDDVVTELQELGITMVRYPAGVQADTFHWADAVGRWDAREPMDIDPRNIDSADLEIPFLGPDEFADLTEMLGAQMLITANIVTGDADEAAAWLAHYVAAGRTHAKYWEIGNESHFEGAVAPEDYAAIFDDFALALRAVDADAQVGLIGCRDTENPIALCVHAPDWNSTVLSTISESPDFIAVHNSYAPLVAQSPPSSDVEYQPLLAASVYLRDNFTALEADLDACGPKCERTAIAVTEHSPLFFPDITASPGEQEAQLAQNRTFVGVLYSALAYQLYIGTPRIQITNHFNMMSPHFQAALLPRPLSDGESVADYDPDPIRTAFFDVFRLYADLGGGSVVSTTVEGAPVLDTDAWGIVPALTDVPVLDVIAGRTDEASLLYVINRDIEASHQATLHIRSVSVDSITVDQLAPADVRAEITHARPDAVVLTTETLSAESSTFTYAFPAHSLTRFRFAPLDG